MRYLSFKASVIPRSLLLKINWKSSSAKADQVEGVDSTGRMGWDGWCASDSKSGYGCE